MRPCGTRARLCAIAAWLGRAGYNRVMSFTRALCVLTLACFLAGPAAAWAQLFRWTNERGEVHYSQGIESVPERFRSGAQFLGYPGQPPSQGPSQSSPATPATPPRTAKIRFTPGQPIMVSARINDGGTATLMLDTGASVTVINPRVLTALGVSSRGALRGSLRGVTGSTPVLLVTVQSIEVAGARFGPLHVVSHDADIGQGDGLLGRDFLDRFAVNIDNAAGIVTLIPK